MLTGRWLLQLEKFSMPMSCNFPTECRRWASTSSFWLVSFCVFFLPMASPTMALFDGTVGLTGRDVVHWYL